MKVVRLTEDKTINPGGKPYPTSGWCIIVCGGSGMGKSTVVDNLLNIDGKHLDVDVVKSLWLKTTQFDGDILTTADGKQYDLDKENIPEPYDFSNPKFVSFVHKVAKPVARARQNAFIKSAGSVTKDRLPNVIFDITGDKITKFMDIIDTVRPLGYQIAVVFVAGEVSQAIEQNERRPRKVDRDILLTKHKDVLYTIDKLFKSNIIKQVDECYIVVQFRIDVNTREGKLAYIKKDNVYKVKSAGKELLVPQNIQHLISSEYEKLISGYYDEN